MPQPLLRVKKIKQFQPYERVSEAKPDLALHIADVVTIWARLEADLGTSLTRLLNVHANFAAAVLAQLNSPLSQKQVISAAADSVLTGDDLKLFKCLMSLYISLSKRRNSVAHGLWFYSPELPDALLFINQRDDLRYHSRLEEKFSRMELKLDHKPLPEDEMDFLSYLHVYREADFTSIKDDIHRLREDFASFWHMMHAESPEERDERYQKLSSAPHIRLRLEPPESTE